MSDANERERTERVDNPDTRTGGYGGSAGGQDPNEDAPDTGSGAGGREQPVTDPLDADEALGNRTGGYGFPPAQREEPAKNEEHES